MNIIVAITGSIAAYKAAVLVRELRKRDINVRVLMTPKSKNFITPLTMATLSQHPCIVENFNPENGDWNSHISLGMWADLLIVAPATANTIAKMAVGIADNLVLDTCLASRAPIWVAPAMDVDMYNNPATIQNLEILKSRGIKILEPEVGFLASGLSGKGRMAEPEYIAKKVDEFICVNDNKKDLTGKKFVVTLGATREKIDPVRFISNFSTGKMGIAIVNELLSRGAVVTAIAGKIDVEIPVSKNLIYVPIESAVDMNKAVQNHFPESDYAIFAAAVADYRPKSVSSNKIKKEEITTDLSIELVENPDIALNAGKLKRSSQHIIGFALESSPDVSQAVNKLQKKNMDAIVFNSLQDDGAGFGYDTNKITILTENKKKEYDLKNKVDVAKDIIDFLVENFENTKC